MNLENPRLAAMLEESAANAERYNADLIAQAVETLRRLAPEKLREFRQPRKLVPIKLPPRKLPQ